MENSLVYSKHIVEDFLRKMNVQVTSVDIELDEDGLQCKISSDDIHFLAGEHNLHFQALSHILKKIIGKQLRNPELKISIDINQYQEKIEEKIKIKAKMLAERSLSLKTEIEMEPMSSYERMIVHGLFTDNPDIQTESIGEGAMRRVVIKPRKL